MWWSAVLGEISRWRAASFAGMPGRDQPEHLDLARRQSRQALGVARRAGWPAHSRTASTASAQSFPSRTRATEF